MNFCKFHDSEIILIMKIQEDFNQRTGMIEHFEEECCKLLKIFVLSYVINNCIEADNYELRIIFVSIFVTF